MIYKCSRQFGKIVTSIEKIWEKNNNNFNMAKKFDFEIRIQFREWTKLLIYI